MAGLSGSVIGLFWNADERRLRMPYRIAIGVALWGAIAVAVSVPVAAVFSGPDALLAPLGREEIGRAGLLIVSSVIGGVVVPALLVVTGRFVDRRRLRDYGFRIDRDWWADLGFGLALGAGLITGVFLLEFAAGWISVTGLFRVDVANLSFWPWFALAIVSAPIGAAGEEVFVRGYLLTNLAEGLSWEPLGERGGVALAVLITSILFGAGHISNPNATVVSSVAVGIAGVLLALGYVVTGEMAVPIGLHVAWNVTEGLVFGFPISGTGYGVSIIGIAQSGPPLVTGGSFGPEAGLVGIAAILVGMGTILAWVRRQEGRVGLAPGIAVPELRR